jgi:hypothetical protein
MKRIVYGLILLLLVGHFSLSAVAQDKASAEAKAKSDQKTADQQKANQESVATTPVRVQIVFSESENGKVTKSLPYTLYINATNTPELHPGGWDKLRIGSKVPIQTGPGNFVYQDVGTNIDGRAANAGDHFKLSLTLERSWVEGQVPVPAGKNDSSQAEPAEGRFFQPIIRQFRTELELKVRDGQTVETTMATDPLSGKVMRVEVTLTTLK